MARSPALEIAARALAALLLCVAAPAAAQNQPEGSSSNATAADPQDDRPVTLTFDKRPSLRVGKVLQLDVRVKSQTDWRDFPAEPAATPKDVFDLHRARLGLEGTFLTRFDYQIEREFHDTTQPWRDAYVDARVLRNLQIQGGRFKIPFGLDQLTSGMDLDFNYRSLAGTYLAPGRDLGLMAHGKLFNDVVKYQAGVFRQGGENVRASERTEAQSARTVAWRLVVKPWNGSRAFRVLRSFAAGIAFTDGLLPEGRNSLRGKTVPGDAFFEHFYVKGQRQRVGAEFQWRPGPASVQGEFIRARDQRQGQGLDNENLPDAPAHGWYLSSTWLVTGERKKDSITPARPFLKGGIGAVELAGRVEHLGSGSHGTTVGSFSSPRASGIVLRADNVWTAGVNWYLNEYIKLQANVIREQRAAGELVIPGQGTLWSRTLRIQFGL
jgi:phosphate-selective porin OprO/OprP